MKDERELFEFVVRRVRGAQLTLLFVGLALIAAGAVVISVFDQRVTGDEFELGPFLLYSLASGALGATGAGIVAISLREDQENLPVWLAFVLSIPVLGRFVDWLRHRADRESFDPSR